MIICEFRIAMPFNIDELNIAILYSEAKSHTLETGGGEGVEWIENKPYDVTDLPLSVAQKVNFQSGQFVSKKIYLSKKSPTLGHLMPGGKFEFIKKSWNSYPYCHTEFYNPYFGEKMRVAVETICVNDGDNNNIFGLSADELNKRKVTYIDIANDLVNKGDYKPGEDPTKFASTKTDRGPLAPGWQDKAKSLTYIYKLVTANVESHELRDTIEGVSLDGLYRRFVVFHRQVFCWLDEWHGLSLDDVRAIEEKTKQELDQLRASGSVQGFVE